MLIFEMKKPYILGIDPGLHGALAVINPEMGQSGLVNVWDTPLYSTPQHNTKVKIDTPKLALQLGAVIMDCEFCIIEEVWSLPRDGHVGAFSFGQSFGILIGMVSALMVPIMFTPPAVWKSTFGLSSDKNASRAKASALYPFNTHLWNLKKHDGRAEAVLLAEFGKRFY